ncbi:MAG: ABC transporter substrate-binding protein [bacterium]|nr:ABC transporter substrate-binding protein [bacterium]
MIKRSPIFWYKLFIFQHEKLTKGGKLSMSFCRTLTAIVLLLSICATYAQNYTGKRVFYVNSYHTGYPASDKTFAAIKQTIGSQGIVFRKIEMDSKRNPDEAFIKKAAVEAKKAIQAFKPDVVILSDDNAAKYLLMPYFRDAELPFVFCCVNWDASVYGLPYQNATGMVEVVLVGELLKQLKKYAKGDRIGFIGGDRYSEHRNREYYEKRFDIRFEKTYFAKRFSEWKDYFARLQNEVDILVMTNHTGIIGWNDEDANDFVQEHIKIPVGTEHEWEMPRALIGVAKDFQEMGTWAADTALKILDGVPPSQIPVTANKKSRLYFNRRIAKILGIEKVPPLAVIVD